MKKNVLFLDRSPLTILYSKMTPYMDDVNYIHVAFSQSDVKVLANYNLKPDYVYLDMFREEYDRVVVDDAILENIDNDIITYTNGRFNLNGAIQSDRGFSLLSYEECIKSALAHYKVWEKIFNEHQVDIILHEPCSLFFNFMGNVLCKKQGGVFAYQIASMSDKYKFSYFNAINDDYTYIELKNNFAKYSANPSLIERDRCERFLKSFRENQNAFFGDILNRKMSVTKLFYMALKKRIYQFFKDDKNIRIYNNIDYWMINSNRAWDKVKNLIGYKLNGVKFVNKLPEGEKYFFYPLHLEPEAVVLYLGEGLYKNQIKLIENIAASLPAGYYLYVKDHPHEYAYREAVDYKRLMQIPNIRLLNQWIQSKAIMKHAKGVITINGTAGLEAMLMNKQSYCFGHNMYSFVPRVNYIKNIKDLKPALYENKNAKYEDDDELMAYIMAYLESSHPGYTDCYSGGVFVENIDYEENAKELARDVSAFIDNMRSYRSICSF